MYFTYYYNSVPREGFNYIGITRIGVCVKYTRFVAMLWLLLIQKWKYIAVLKGESKSRMLKNYLIFIFLLDILV